MSIKQIILFIGIYFTGSKVLEALDTHHNVSFPMQLPQLSIKEAWALAAEKVSE